MRPLAERVVQGERAAVAQALNLTEDRRAPARAQMAALLAEFRRLGALETSQRLGLTGPPGVGKSTLVSALTRSIRHGKTPESVGVLAIDPSSIRSGGALLGDRTRIAPDPEDHGIFVRSLATAGELGGLARSVPLGVLVLAAAFDVVLVETVGVGQTETDVAHVVDAVAFVVQPGSGDALQFLKAGVMEVPDVLVVNKADQSALAARAVLELRSALQSLHQAGVRDRGTPIVQTSALDGTGVDNLVATFRALHERQRASGELTLRRRAGAIAWALRTFRRRHGEIGVEAVGGEEALEREITSAIDAGEEVPAMVERIASALGATK